MNTDTNTKSKKNISVKIIIIIVAAAVVLAGTGFVIFKAVKKFRGNDEPMEVLVEDNVTFFKCHMFQTITDSDLDDIKKAITDTVGDKVLSISKGEIPLAKTQFMTDENDELIDAGDVVEIILSFLDNDEKGKMFTAVITAYKLNEKCDDINDIFEIKDGHRGDYDNK